MKRYVQEIGTVWVRALTASGTGNFFYLARITDVEVTAALARRRGQPGLSADLWPQLFSDVSCIALWISSEKILTRLYSVLHWFHKRLEANVKNPRENRCFQTVIVFSFG